MKTTLSCAIALAALLAGSAMAGSAMAGDAPRAEMRADRDGDGRVSRAEATSTGAERSGEWFDKLDLDKDGYLTQDEMKQGRQTRHDNMRADMREKMEARFKEADANSDGSLSLDEVQAKMPRVADRFSTLDTDKNGLLSQEELKHGHGRHPEPKT